MDTLAAYIDPLVEGRGRVTEACQDFAEKVDEFISDSQDDLLSGLSWRDADVI